MKKTTTRTVIAAAPGWYVVTPISSDDFETVVGLHNEPVVAWEIERTEETEFSASRPDETFVHHVAIPITMESNHDENTMILTPNGAYEVVLDRTFPNAFEALAYFREIHAERKAKGDRKRVTA